MIDRFSRTRRLLGAEGMERLAKARVCVFGIGGVGGHLAEALVRSGVGALDLVDSDRVSLTNLNRQIIATEKTVGRSKVEAAKERFLELNPDCRIETHELFYLPETEDRFDFSQYDYIADCIDTVSGKLSIILRAKEAGVPVISAMGAGNKLDPTRFEVADIYDTDVCPLAKVMRRELKKRGVKELKVVYSREKAMTPIEDEDNSPGTEETKGTAKRPVPGSTAFVPAVAGLIMAGEIVKDLALGGVRYGI